MFKRLRKSFRDLYRPYWCLVALRIALVFVPQTGYIHPDEFFQSIEVLIGKFFDIEVNKPWEFTTTFPIRSMTLPYIVLGASYKMLRFINTITINIFYFSIISPYTLVLYPRLIMCALSFLVDYSIFRICVNNNEKYKARLLILATSYVTIVFGTRTFTNTFELILFALLLYYVADSITYSIIVIRQQEYLNKRHEKSKTPVEKAKIHKLRLFLREHSLRNCMQVATITVAGFFNRPTFLAYAVLPVFFWLYRGIGFKSIANLHFHLRIIVIILCAVPSILCYITFDSLYYGYLSFAEIERREVTINHFVFTPLNFVKYNMNPKNLANHGLHPRFLHVAVNIPLLFNILGVMAIFEVFVLFTHFFNKKYHLLPTVHSIKGMMISSLIAPVTLLSVFPHQEPRFLIPTIVPIVYLYSNCILKEDNNEIVEVTKESLTFEYAKQKLKAKRYVIFKIWVALNVIFVLFFGFIHQGGVLSAVSHLSKEMNLKSPVTYFKIYSSHVYSVPESLLMQKSTEKLYMNNKIKYKVAKRVELHEEGSKDLSLVIDEVVSSFSDNVFDTTKNVTYIMLPSSLKYELKLLASSNNLQLNCTNFYPHLSTEAFPDLSALVNQIFNMEYYKISQLFDNVLEIVKSFGLTLCKTTFV